MPSIITRITKINKESLTTKLTLIIIGLTAGSALLFPATYASFHPVTSSEIADETILSRDIRNGQVGSVDIGTGQVASGDIQDRTIRRADVAVNALSPNMEVVQEDAQVAAGEGLTWSAQCPSGYRVTGGGFSTASSSLRFTSNYPSLDLSGWSATAFNDALTGEEDFTVFAVCMGPIPP